MARVGPVLPRAQPAGRLQVQLLRPGRVPRRGHQQPAPAPQVGRPERHRNRVQAATRGRLPGVGRETLRAAPVRWKVWSQVAPGLPLQAAPRCQVVALRRRLSVVPLVLVAPALVVPVAVVTRYRCARVCLPV